jgi:AcrR family transcriptional regulator
VAFNSRIKRIAAWSESSIMAIRDEVAALKRSRIIDAAVDLFYTNGYDNTTLEAVGEKLGVTKPFIYSHFKSKAELLGDICSRGIAASLEVVDNVLGTEGTPPQKLERLSRGFVTAVLGNQKYIAIFNREEKGLSPEHLAWISDMRRDFDRKLALLLEEGRQSGDFQFGDANIAALAIGGMVSWASVWYRDRGRMSIDDVASEMTELILNMVQARQSGQTLVSGP